MDTRRKDCATGHLERKKTGYWYMVFRTKDEFRTINTWTKDRDEAQAQLDAILAKKNAEMAGRSERSTTRRSPSWIPSPTIDSP